MRRSNQLKPINQMNKYRHPTNEHNTFREVFAAFERDQERKGLSPFSMKHDRENMRAILKHLSAEMSVTSVTPEFLESHVFDAMRARGLRSTTIIGRRKTLYKVYHFSVQHGYCTYNPIDQVVKMRSDATEIPSLSIEQVHALLSKPKMDTFTGQRDRTMIELMLDNGIRLRELLDLRVDQVDVKGRVLRKVLGKNRKLEDLPLSQRMCEKLQTYLELRGDSASESLFVTLDGRAISRRTYQEHMTHYGQQAGITDVRVSPHTLRHTFAKQWILAGGDAFTLQRILRHSTMDMVKRYIHLWGHEIQQRHDLFSPMAKL